eukprot:CAMPEP_0113972578 /NCGR_PEP_ID=MMETSP0011_2-20120614/13593_1 /TAXON_ID=101924 /ORGANISM="Rhodosorus marinus" /LENGTH=678 /DNA_ID=CAMNT_0000989647 /DNA_START=379 /DNA_END=2415 /DNA_ORIENTATION=- /assembly_acc=CAM_ASM_000156
MGVRKAWLTISLALFLLGALIIGAGGERILRPVETARKSSTCTARLVDVQLASGAEALAARLQSSRTFWRRVPRALPHQQFFDAFVDGARVLGGRITVLSRDGVAVGAYGKSHEECDFSGVPRLDLSLDEAEEIARKFGRSVDDDVLRKARYDAELILDPVREMYMVRVEEMSLKRWTTFYIDASYTGKVVDVQNNEHMLDPGQGRGYFGDVRDLTELTTLDTSKERERYVLSSPYGFSEVLEARYEADETSTNIKTHPVVDEDNVWTRKDQSYTSDLAYFLMLVDEFFLSVFGIDLASEARMPLRGIVRISKNLSNAFFQPPLNFLFGEGDGKEVLPLSADETIVSHECGHGLTYLTSGLIYRDLSGALNEALSDIVAVGFGHHYSGKLDPVIAKKAFPALGGLRSIKDPQKFGHPSHIKDVAHLGTNFDNGGVHINSGVINHWFYLLATGGRNADKRRRSGEAVKGIGVDFALSVALLSFTSVPSDADFCDARRSSLTVAKTLFTEKELASVRQAWKEVGVNSGYCKKSSSSQKNCRDLCESGMSCVERDGSSYCVRCGLFHRKRGSETWPCCEAHPATGSCRPMRTLKFTDRCRVHKGMGIVTEEDDRLSKRSKKSVKAKSFWNDFGSVCHTLNNFKKYGGVCKIVRRSSEWTCSYKAANEELRRATENRKKTNR